MFIGQELLAIGTSNIVNSFVQGYPGTGSLSRGAVNNGSGVRTPMGGFYTGVLVIAALFLTPLFYYIPKAALASIIIAAVRIKNIFVEEYLISFER